MPRKHSKRQRKMRGGGGWLESLGLGSLFGKKEQTYSSSMSNTNPMPTPNPMPTQTQSQFLPVTPVGGKSRSRKMRGGFESNAPTGLVVYAAPFSGPTAEPQTKVGGRTRRRGRKNRRRTHRKH